MDRFQFRHSSLESVSIGRELALPLPPLLETAAQIPAIFETAWRGEY